MLLLCTRTSGLLKPQYAPFSSFVSRRLVVVGTVKMLATEEKRKRPICPTCSKPTRTCLCSRLLTPGIENSVSVTILQHSLESKHPLNSTRIAKLGLKNLSVITVSDVNVEARFEIRLVKPDSEWVKPSKSLDFSQCLEMKRKTVSGSELFSERLEEKNEDLNLNGTGVEDNAKSVDLNDIPKCTCMDVTSKINLVSAIASEAEKNSAVTGRIGACGTTANFHNEEPNSVTGEIDIVSVNRGTEGLAVTVNMGKYGSIRSLSHIWSEQTNSQESTFDKILALPGASEALSKGFVVKKLQKKQPSGSLDLEEFEEFNLGVPPGSVLLFPSDRAVCVDSLEGSGFKVKNLIVLDGTWAKAMRIYNENSWLKILPHLKLKLNKMSLYSEVRHQPKTGYLSTIESIVYALKELGDNHEGLENLLDAFESMVGDQRRCKEERLNKISST